MVPNRDDENSRFLGFTRKELMEMSPQRLERLVDEKLDKQLTSGRIRGGLPGWLTSTPTGGQP
jgi:hypothetical protein